MLNPEPECCGTPVFSCLRCAGLKSAQGRHDLRFAANRLLNRNRRSLRNFHVSAVAMSITEAGNNGDLLS
jgi:hypothetical protein